MAPPRFFVEAPLAAGDSLQLPDNTAHHLARVLRLAAGEQVVIFNGQGGEYLGNIEHIDSKQVRLRLESFNEANREAGLPVHLGMAVIKKDAMDSVLAKAVEMGVTGVTPVITDRCSVARKVIRNRHAHWQQVLVAACEQSGLNILPTLDEAVTLAEWFARTSANLRIIAVPGSRTVVPAFASPSNVALLIGPEGGFTREELGKAGEAGYQPMTLGQRVMRAETAPVALLTVIQHRWGDFTARG